jgi:division protein CdvB (Snf7/Vps24/ESCRT-III family)
VCIIEASTFKRRIIELYKIKQLNSRLENDKNRVQIEDFLIIVNLI